MPAEQATNNPDNPPVPRRQRNNPHNTVTSPLPKPQKNTRANIRIGSLNIQGRGANSIYDPSNKWTKINQLVRDKKIAILAVQEAHLNQCMTEQLNDLFVNLSIFASPDPENMNARGVAFVINQRIAAVGKNIKIETIIPGRAMLLETKWHNDESLTILNVYAPTNMRESRTFWNNLWEMWTNTDSTLPFPDIILGDFNITEHPQDRCNGRWDNQETVDALQNLMKAFQMKDGWRDTFPNTQTFTMVHNGNHHQSRLDRIYIAEEQTNRAHEWTIDDVPIPTDHKLISVNIVIPNTPYIGKGRWAIPNFVLGNKKYLQNIEDLGKSLLNNLDRPIDANRLDNPNTQLLWKQFKTDIIDSAKTFAKKTASYLDRRLKEVDAEIRAVNADRALQLLDRNRSIATLTKEKKVILTKRFQTRREVAAARNLLEGETVCKYWTSLQKQKPPRDLIRTLKIPNGEAQGSRNYTKRSDEMAQIAKEHHDNLQDLDTNHNPNMREEAIQTALNAINTSLTDEESTQLGTALTDSNVLAALASAANGKSPGLDGIPYELWKTLNKRFQDHQKSVPKTSLQ
ncbi:hypothetical protein AGABI1DRAFT_94557 [Agaricus bisporus var. burnettii JB137-S8]|uniref:Endonuclease/exonuclease/phosphatase domain-containing protein n=1 Tax=Agaricus bisporus var. burnettii (strain JB137-S8 / ATCC MYA-4627 / FGSC 10392) TaxID=597362 RepID=K5XMU5_AGABU|nr:uncharacterized protein AGABI1DRAFT_94557 [Agaricus bisporus var. burnettii JB137-S8]EKM75935.1 hypothetical protein AGABI1DRAFT_94557 [Agaricus bisporus var. burnettii JB137-S8]